MTTTVVNEFLHPTIVMVALMLRIQGDGGPESEVHVRLTDAKWI